MQPAARGPLSSRGGGAMCRPALTRLLLFHLLLIKPHMAKGGSGSAARGRGGPAAWARSLLSKCEPRVGCCLAAPTAAARSGRPRARGEPGPSQARLCPWGGPSPSPLAERSHRRAGPGGASRAARARTRVDSTSAGPSPSPLCEESFPEASSGPLTTCPFLASLVRRPLSRL